MIHNIQARRHMDMTDATETRQLIANLKGRMQALKEHL